MSYIYKLTSPSGKIYIGQSTISEHNKKQSYKFAARKTGHNNRYIINAITKYGWENILFEVIQDCAGYSKQELGDAEIKWIAELHSQNKKIGYNITRGGEGVDSVTARNIANKHYKNQTPEQKVRRAAGCAKGQKKRYNNSVDSANTKEKKSISHRGEYLLESPDGRQWHTKLGLKKFAEDFADEIDVNFWVLFHAYRKGYTQKVRQRPANKGANLWKVERIDV